MDAEPPIASFLKSMLIGGGPVNAFKFNAQSHRQRQPLLQWLDLSPPVRLQYVLCAFTVHPMSNEIISYNEMCQREGLSLQRGMNFAANGRPAIILMSQRSNAPYDDVILDDGSTLVYEGHDHPRTQDCLDPKAVDQPKSLPSGKLTENGKFFAAAEAYKNEKREPEHVRVYEKLHTGIWSFNGVFHLVDAWIENDGTRNVFKFKLHAIDDDGSPESQATPELNHRRIIPTPVKLAVWKRDEGKCVKCGATNELHFDHILPYSRGGTSLTAENVQLLCARHNLQKHDNIE